MAPSLQPTNSLNWAFVATHAHTLDSGNLQLWTGQASIAPTVVASMLLSFPLFAGRKRPKAQDSQRGRGCPEASSSIPLLTADSQPAEECNPLTNPTCPIAQGVSVSTLPAPSRSKGRRVRAA